MSEHGKSQEEYIVLTGTFPLVEFRPRNERIKYSRQLTVNGKKVRVAAPVDRLKVVPSAKTTGTTVSPFGSLSGLPKS